MNDGLTLEGDLSEIRLPTLLMSLYREKETGVLQLECGPYRKKLFIQEGDVIFAASNDPDDRLGECLLRRGVITVDQYLESARRIAPGKRQGEILVDMGALTPDDLLDGVSQQLYDIIFSLIPLTSGAYTLTLEEFASDDLITLNVSLPSLLFKGMEKVKRWSLIYPTIGTPESRMKKVATLPAFYHRLEFTPEQEQVFSLCGEGLPISALLDASYLNPFETYRMLWIGLTLGLLERESSAEASAAATVWNAEEVIEHYNDLYAFLHRALGKQAQAAAREAMAIAAPAHPVFAEDQSDLETCGRADVDRLLAALRAMPEPDRKPALKGFLDEVLYAFTFVAGAHLKPEDAIRFREYMKARGTPA